MLSPLRNRFGIPGVISVIALVFAMLGGAYAASDNGGSGSKASASAKRGKPGKPGKRGKRGKPGPAGPQGPAGPAGPAGAKGDTGAKGDKGDPGTNGTNGTSVTNTTEPKGLSCKEGGTKLVGTSTTFACNGEKGKEGSPWTELGTLPPEKTLTGVWGPVSPSSTRVNMSFALPVDPTPQIVFVGPEEVKPEEGCPGTSESGIPLADPGKFCVYTSFGFNLAVLQSTVSPAGAFFVFTNKEAEEVVFSGQGVWAVTAAE